MSYKSTNTFSGGLQQDIGYDLLQNKFYYYMLNGSIVTYSGLTSGNPENCLGNRHFISIPDTYTLWKGQIDSTSIDVPYNFNVIINGISTTFLGIYSTNSSLYSLIKSTLEALPTLQAIGIRVSFNPNNIFIWSTTTNLAITVTGNAVFTNILNVGTLPYIPGLQDLKIIGWCTIRDNIYILSTDSTDAVGNTLQIWKLTYSKLTLVPVIELRYNSILFCTTEHPIPNPGGIIGIYENKDIQRLYWTDYFNKIRSINVTDPNLMALDPSIIDLIPSISFDIPILQELRQNGQLEVGVYQASYRLLNSNGAVTSVSVPSNLVSVVPEAEANSALSFVKYAGADKGTLTNKSITWNIHSVDTNFEEIEVIILKRTDKNAPPELIVLPRQQIPSGGSYTFTYYGNEPGTTLTLQEFNALSGTFSHCKAIAVKDSILFAANTKKVQAELSYDARAYRANSPNSGAFNSFSIINSGVTISFSYNAATQVPGPFAETEDTINPDQNTWIYNPSTGNLGGAGPWINYEFGTLAIKDDSDIAFPPGGVLYNGSPSNLQRPFQDWLIQDITLNVPEADSSLQRYKTHQIFSSTKSVYYSSILKDYQRGETYRFGIQFFDLSGDPYFTKWISDIKLPDIYNNTGAFVTDPGSLNHIYEDGTQQPLKDFRLSFVAQRPGVPYPELFIKHLYIKFNINIPSILLDQISGYSIVRVQRTDSDKTIKGTGIIHPIQMAGQSGGTNNTEMFLSASNITGGGTPNTWMNSIGGDNRGNNGQGSLFNFTFDCPDFKLEQPISPAQGDQLIISGKLTPIEYVAMDVTAGIPSIYGRFNFAKYYQFEVLPIQSTPLKLNFVHNTAFGQTNINLLDPTSSGYQFHNITCFTNGNPIANVNFHNKAAGNPINSSGTSLGIKTLFLEIDQSTPLAYYGIYQCTETLGHKLLGYYYRPNTNQYGGASYSSRTLNEYILCSEFRPLTKGNSGITDSIRIFGGDVYTTIYDEQKQIKYWGATPPNSQVLPEPQVDQTVIGSITNNNFDVNKSYSLYYPVQTSCNPDLRHGIHPNNDEFKNNPATHDAYSIDTQESFNYNPVYSCENDTRVYFPKPLDFLVNNENDNRIRNSHTKISGELQDSWSQFDTNDYIDVDGIHGPINQLINFKDHLWFFQDKALGTVAVNERSAVIDTSGSSLAVGSGGILTRRDYTSTTIGSKHQFSFAVGPDDIHFFDILQQRFYEITPEGLKQLSGLDGYLNTHINGNILIKDNPYKFLGFTSTYDYTFDQFITSCNNENRSPDKGFCVSYNSKIDGFHSFYSYLTPVFINDKQNYFQVSKDLHSLWIANEGPRGSFFDQIGDFRIDFIVNPEPTIEKTWDNLEWNTTSLTSGTVSSSDLPFIIDQKQNTFTSLRVFNSYQNTGFIPMTPLTLKREKRIWRTQIRGNAVKYLPGNFNIFDQNNLYIFPNRYPINQRMKSNYIFINMLYDNQFDTKLTLENVSTYFRPNTSRIRRK